MARRLATHLEAAHRVDPELRVRIMTAHDALRDAADLLEHEGDYADVLAEEDGDRAKTRSSCPSAAS